MRGRVKSLDPSPTGPASQDKFSRREIFGEKKFFGTDDLFGGLAHSSMPPELLQSIECAECGTSFLLPKATGRPQKFCSPACRAENKHRLMRKWEATRRSPVRIEFATCRYCLRIFEVPRRPGRLPHYCSPVCKQAFLRPTPPLPEPGIFG